MFKNFDWWLFLTNLLLLVLSLTVLSSIAPDSLINQLIFSLISLTVFFIISTTDYRIFKSLSSWAYLVSLVLLLLTFIIGQETRGAARWIPLGPLQFQPSEIVKPLLILAFAGWLFQPGWGLKKLIYLVLALAIPTGLIFKQPDLGSALVIAFTWGGLIFAANIPLLILAGLGISLGLFGPVFWHFLKDYQRQRLLTFLNPTAAPLKAGYNALQAMITVGSGQIFGRGLGHGTQSHLKFLPERHTDFIFASLTEELGLLGASLILLLFALLLWRTLVIAHQSQDKFGQLICAGVFSFLFIQVFINIGMNLGLLPITGIPLPLVSSGGSSILATFISLGLVQSVARHRPSPQTLQIH